jgi:hypothetical protein
MAKIYGAAARSILLQHQALGDFGAQGVEWIDESYDDLVTEEDRVVRASFGIFQVKVWDVVTRFSGPTDPIPDPADQPGSNWPTADIVNVVVKPI